VVERLVACDKSFNFKLFPKVHRTPMEDAYGETLNECLWRHDACVTLNLKL
jgi:hypothetical protein